MLNNYILYDINKISTEARTQQQQQQQKKSVAGFDDFFPFHILFSRSFCFSRIFIFCNSPSQNIVSMITKNAAVATALLAKEKLRLFMSSFEF